MSIPIMTCTTDAFSCDVFKFFCLTTTFGRLFKKITSKIVLLLSYDVQNMWRRFEMTAFNS